MIRRVLRAAFAEARRKPTTPAAAMPSPPPPIPRAPHVQLLRGKRALIVGAGPNIGMGIAHVLGSAGADLVLADIRDPTLVDASESLRATGVSVRSVVTDIANTAGVDTLLQTLVDSDTMPDIVVLNAGVPGEPCEVGSLRIEDVEQLFRTNVFGHWYLADQLAARFASQQRTASFVFVTSIHQRTLLGLPAYSASKAALGMLVRELAVQYAPLGIRVNAVAPGWVALDAQQELPPHQLTPMRASAIHPHNIGLAVLHLAADELSGQTTGTSLTVDGGLSLHSYLTARPR